MSVVENLLNSQIGSVEGQDKALDKIITETVKDMGNDRKQRENLVDKIFTFGSIYMMTVFLILFLQGGQTFFHLSDNIILTLLGTTTVDVVAMMASVVAYYYKKK